jgi:hypothetical protein
MLSRPVRYEVLSIRISEGRLLRRAARVALLTATTDIASALSRAHGGTRE